MGSHRNTQNKPTNKHQAFNMADFVKSTLVAAGPGVVLFSKSYCPYCVRAKQALLSIGIEPITVELDQRTDSRLIQIALMQMSGGQRTVPSAWLDGKHIGGSDDVVDGVSSGLFRSVPAGVSKKVAQQAGLQKCGANDGLPCLCGSA
jgi:glutaredoxin 3